ncbi:MAG: hypothetical protein KC656_29790, partial [Myxococcales bacterium]|nr:hypothetical protein [Myxococcales bacterium]
GLAIAAELAGRDTTGLEAFYGRAWLGPIAPWVRQAGFRLGFVESAVIGRVPPEALDLPEWRTLRVVTLEDAASLPLLARLPLVRVVRGAVHGVRGLPKGLVELEVSPDSWEDLRQLDLSLLRRLTLHVDGMLPPACWDLHAPVLEHLEITDLRWGPVVQGWGVPFVLTLRDGAWTVTLQGTDVVLWTDAALDDQVLLDARLPPLGARVESVEVRFPHASVRPDVWEAVRQRLQARCPRAQVRLTASVDPPWS